MVSEDVKDFLDDAVTALDEALSRDEEEIDMDTWNKVNHIFHELENLIDEL